MMRRIVDSCRQACNIAVVAGFVVCGIVRQGAETDTPLATIRRRRSSTDAKLGQLQTQPQGQSPIQTQCRPADLLLIEECFARL